MKRILYVVTLVALALAAPLTALKVGGSDAAHAGSAPCASEIMATDATGQGSLEQFKAPERVFINGKEFPPALTGLTFTVRHLGSGTVVASGSFFSGPDGSFTAQLVWDGENSFQGDQAYRIVVTPAGACPATDDIQYLDDRPPPSRKVEICHRRLASTNPYGPGPLDPAIGNNGDLFGGHLNPSHQGPVFPEPNWGDIIPPYEYERTPSGQRQVFPGYNWTAAGQAIWQNNCQPVTPPTPGLKPITPLLDCVEILAAGGFLAHFGYDNSLNSEDTEVPVGEENGYLPLPLDRGQPTTFEGGSVVVEDANIQAESEDGSPLTWSLTDNPVTASLLSEPCQGSITIIKEVEGPLNPDPGRFNLEIDGEPIGEPAGDGESREAAVSAAPHTVGESGVDETNLSDFHTHIVCRTDAGDGDVVAKADGPTSVQVTVGRGEAVVCTITNTRQEGPGPGPLALTPVLECVVMNDGEPDIAVWGYQNPNKFVVTVPIGAENEFSGSSQDLDQPTHFEEDRRVIGLFQTTFDAGTPLVWTLTGNTATASSGSPRCTATVELRKVVVPSDDPGVFNLLINEEVLATGGNGTSTGPHIVGVGEGTASETAGNPETNLANYETTIDCTRNGVPVPSVEGTKVDGAVANGDEVVCTFTNRRLTTPPVEPPVEPPVPPVEPPVPPVEPPVPPVEPPVPPVEPPLPPAEQLDLVLTKTAEPTTVQVGELITWTMTVTNESSAEAADVNGARADDRPYGMQLLSLKTSQGVCAIGAGCALGRLLPGDSVTVTAVTRATQVGDAVNCVQVGSEEIESDYLNNTACALARVTGNPPAVVDRCGSLVVSPRVLVASRESVVLTRARTLLGRPVADVLVRAKGAGVVASARTNARGIARFVFTAPRLGIIRFTGTGPRSAAGTTGSRCRTLVGVLPPRQPPPLTGRDG